MERAKGLEILYIKCIDQVVFIWLCQEWSKVESCNLGNGKGKAPSEHSLEHSRHANNTNYKSALK